MFRKEFLKLRKFTFGFLTPALYLIIAASDVAAQSASKAKNLQSEGSSWWLIMLFVLVGFLVVAIYFRHKTKNSEELSATPYKRVPYTNGTQKKVATVDQGLEWITKNPNGTPKLNGNKNGLSGGDAFKKSGFLSKHEIALENIDDVSAVLPIYSFLKLKPAKPYEGLSISNDGALLCAIEQIGEEFESDEEIRSLAVRVLAAFRTSNSVEALEQVALYDLSSNLRSTAVLTLSDFDHESVFETILLACADPTREVRAAAARALFHLTFDRSQAWTRIANLRQSGRMIQMARAAIEADLVERSFERLVHRDRKYAYEAFALLTLLIKAGEVQVVEDFLRKNKDCKLRRAILHTVKVSRNKHGLDLLNSLLKNNELPPDFQEDIDKTIEEMGFVTV